MKMDDRLFRNAMGKFATGVTVLTTYLKGSSWYDSKCIYVRFTRSET